MIPVCNKQSDYNYCYFDILIILIDSLVKFAGDLSWVDKNGKEMMFGFIKMMLFCLFYLQYVLVLF